MEWRALITWWIIFCITYSKLFRIYLKKHVEKANNPSIRIYVNKTENIITFRIKKWYYLKLLMPETRKLLGNFKKQITEDGNGKNVPYLEITEVVLIHSNSVNNDYQRDLIVLYIFTPNKWFFQLLDISAKKFMF